MTSDDDNKHILSYIPSHRLTDTDFDWFRKTDRCETCRNETYMHPKCTESRRGTVLWMYGDMGTMMISVDDGTAPWELTGRCYHDADPETGADCIYQIMEYMTGPPHGCMFRVRKIEGPRSEIQNDAMQQIRKTENVSLVHPSDEYCPQICKLC